MITVLLVLIGLVVLVVAVCCWLTLLEEKRERMRRELQRRLILQTAEQRMQAIDRAALNAMFDAARGRWPS